MGIRVYSLLWVVQDFVHQPYIRLLGCFDAQGKRIRMSNSRHEKVLLDPQIYDTSQVL